MARRVVLHVGTMKSGTSFVQSRLFGDRERLAEVGIEVPSPDWRHLVAAVNDVLSPGSQRREWAQVIDAVRSHPATSVISMEYLGPAGRMLRQRVVDSFGDVDLTVVVTARDLNRQIPAMWQERVQNGDTLPLADYVDAVRATRRSAPADGPEHPHAETGHAFWRQQALDRVVDRWVRTVGPERVVVVTVPPAGESVEVLWRRFASVIGAPVEGMGDTGSVNASLGAAGASVLLRVNELLEGRGLDHTAGRGLRKHVLAKVVLAGYRVEEPRIGHPVTGWVERTSERIVRRTAATGARVVGDLSDLRPVDVPGIDPADVAPALVAEAATDGLADLVAHRCGLGPPVRRAARAERLRVGCLAQGGHGENLLG